MFTVREFRLFRQETPTGPGSDIFFFSFRLPILSPGSWKKSGFLWDQTYCCGSVLFGSLPFSIFLFSLWSSTLSGFSTIFFPFYRNTLQPYAFKKQLFKAAVGVVALLVIIGYINSIIPRIKKMDLVIDKKVDGMEELTIAFASDIHMGTIIGPRRTNQIVEHAECIERRYHIAGRRYRG
jgi:hypothetical protein